MVTCSKLPSEDGSVISNESEKLNSGRGLTVLKVTAQQKLTKEEMRRRDGESHTLMQIQTIYSTASLQTRSGVSQMQNIFSHSQGMWHCSFFLCQKGSHLAVSRDGPDEYAWDRHSADMIQYVRLVDAVTQWQKHILTNAKMQKDQWSLDLC